MLFLDNSSCSQNAGGTGEIITVGLIQAFSGKTERRANISATCILVQI